MNWIVDESLISDHWIKDGEDLVAVVYDSVETAQLIASAPDLLEALKQIAALGADKQTGGYELLENAIKLAKEAIAKTKEIQK